MKNFLKKFSEKIFTKKTLKITLFLFLLGTVFVAGLFIYYMKDLPDPDKINKRIVAESTKIYDRTGQHLLYKIHGEENRTLISMDQIPDSVKYATVALEDEDFYDHHGLDFKGIARAAFFDIIHRKAAQGGSTITQQFVKNSILTSEKKISRKIKEVILALEMEQKFSKKDILKMYLNEIPYGSNAYGIEAAAQTFFNKHASDLTLAESALLASLPKAPTFYSPFGSNTDRLEARWSYTLDRMAQLGYITNAQKEEAKKVDILSEINPKRDDIKAPHFVMHIKEQLVKELGEDEMKRKGFKVYTTLDWSYQQVAEKVVEEKVEEIGEKHGFSNASLVALNPKNGQILAMVGSRDYFDEEIDGEVNVALRPRQPGSSFKPYVYAEAFELGYTRKTQLFDVETNFSTSEDEDEEYIPQNYNGKFIGPVQIEDALATSLNIPAVKTLYLAGADKSIKLAKAMGIEGLNNPDRYGLALVLGGGEVKLLNHTSAFSVFANKGKRQEKNSILKIEDHEGEVLSEYKNKEGEKVMDEQTALQISDILSDNKLRTPLFGESNNLNIPGHQIMAKTGTTNEYRDGWLLGSTPSLTVGVWAGNNDNTKMKPGASGSQTAGPIWNAFFKDILENTRGEEFESPEDLEETGKEVIDGDLEVKKELDVCEYEDKKYCLANDACPDKLKEEKDFYNAHSILYYVDKDDPLGDEPKNPDKDSQFDNWEDAVRDWLEEEEDDEEQWEIPDEECKKEYFKDMFANIKIRNLSDGKNITNQKITIKTAVSGEASGERVEFFVDGKKVAEDKSKPFETTYSFSSEENDSEIEIKVRLHDDYGGQDEDSVVVKTSF
ncbi:MAG: PBP1A family penicillin-binding protein [Candidatus Moraniibacteriota bacterium]